MGKSIRVVEKPRRQGDPPVLVGDASEAKRLLRWHPHYSDLEEILTHACKWHCKRHG